MIIRILPEVTVIYLLIFARVGSSMMLMPALGETAILVQARLGFALMTTLILYPLVAKTYPPGLSRDFSRLLVYLAGELAVGLAIGLAGRLVLAATQVAGTVIANQLGLGFAMSVDPTQGQQGVIFGNFLSVLAVAMIFITDLDHLALAGATSSFQLFPPGDWLPVGDFAKASVIMVGEAFQIGIQMSAPFLAFGLVFQLGLGVLSKLMPQFQIYFAAMPLNIGAGMVLFSILIVTVMVWYMDHVRDGLARLVPH
ncbi:MAG: flagellar biosynthetic protein FliR [Ancalomicrobiaceae bacterium]|nr:flagellar biosynthetic protein FliR [Ancalomicrobiaceae bacterium]